MVHRLALLVLTVLGLAGCGLFARRVDVRFHDDFPPLPENTPVELWVGESDRPRIPIAIISSQRTAERSAAARQAQLDELRARARRMGAHAIENLRVERAEVRGFVADPRVPFTAFKQGEFELYFVRGTAVRYTDAPSPSAAP